MKTYPLKIRAVHTDEERIYMSKGHHDAHLFMEAVRAYGETGGMTFPSHERVRRIRPRGFLKFLSYLIPWHYALFPATFTRVVFINLYQPPSP